MRLSHIFSIFLVLAIAGLSIAASAQADKLLEDINWDGKVDINDAIELANAFDSQPNDDNWNLNADLISDSHIDILDAIKLASRFGASMPIAAFTESAHAVPAGTSIEFDPSESYDLGGEIVLYEWDFDDDGIYDQSTTSPDIVSFTYMNPGTYNVTLRVTDNDGLTNTATDTKTITPMKVIPEVPLGTIAVSAAMIIALITYFALPKWRRKQPSVRP